ncbi:ankyrin repeat-containing domain protein [Aspergillus granulosus]|uniref:Ankyrin repeat-containing domain protein n=1 Tax=Aspergillus granulosus TaxID=176169 RepID=A0ABR4H5K3_9EURO
MAARWTNENQYESDPPPQYRPPSPAPSYRTLDIRIRESLSKPRVGLTGRILNAIVPRTRGRDARIPAAIVQTAPHTAIDSQPPAPRDAGANAIDTKGVNLEAPAARSANAEVSKPVAADTKGIAREAAYSKATNLNPPIPKRTEGSRPADTKQTKTKGAKTLVVYTKSEIKAFEKVGAEARRAIEKNDEKLFSALLEEKYNWNTPLQDGSRLLHIAAELGRTPILMALLEHKVDVVVEDAKGYTPLHTAIRNGRTTVVQILVVAEGDWWDWWDWWNWWGRPWSSLELAAERGDEDMVKALLHFIVPRYKNDRVGTLCRSGLQVVRALRCAAYKGHQNLATILYNHTSQMTDPVVRDHYFCIIYSAICKGWSEILEQILSRFSRDGSIHEVANHAAFLVAAATKGNTDIIKQLLRAGIPVNCNNGSAGRGQYPLHQAAALSRVEAVKLLLDWGADPNLINDKGENAMNAALGCNAPLEILRMLLESGVDIHVVDQYGRSPYQDALTDRWGRNGELLKLINEYSRHDKYKK